MKFFGEKRIYFDHAATTPVDPAVLREMQPYFRENFGNPGSVHMEGRTGAWAVEEARKRIARALSAHADEIIFTGSGTEANNLAIFGVYRAHRDTSAHVITTSIEHPSVLEPVRALAGRGLSAYGNAQAGARVTELGVDEKGRVNPKTLREVLSDDTLLVSIMYINNEIGSIQPIAECVKEVRAFRKKTGKRTPYVHVDASQAPLFAPLSMEKLGIDLMTLDAQKVYGPKGVGLLYKRRDVELAPLILGGDQERGFRASTENVPGIVGFARALELAEERREKDSAHLMELRNYFVEKVQHMLPQALLNGGMEHRAPNNVNISIPGLESSFMVVWLDEHGVSCGSRSACTAGDDEASYVIKALGAGEDRAMSSLRITLGRGNTKREIDRAVRVLSLMVAALGVQRDF